MTEATEFDHETAWKEAAEPAFRRLPVEIVKLYELTCEVAKDLHQDNDCSMKWPEDGGEFRKRFDAFDDATLALASRVVYAYGHWSSNGITESTSGGTWKFAKYCDQVLARRLGVSRAYRSDKGASYHVSEGELRVGLSTPWSRGSGEPLPATREACAEVKAAIDVLKEPDGYTNCRAWERWEDAAREAVKRVASRHVQPAELAALDTSRFMVPQGTWAKRRDDERRAKADAAAEPRFEAIVLVVRSVRDAFGDDTKSIEDVLFQFFLQLHVSRTFRDRVVLAAGDGASLNEHQRKLLDK